ncbi:MAG: hypothetical protein ACOC16_01595 [Nanoarchaeota archaeon]
MNNKEKKKLQLYYAKKNINFYFKLLENNFYSKYNKYYIKDILKISQSFNIRLKREEKLKFCKHCHTFFNINNHIIRLDNKKKTLNYICKNCKNIKKIRYK